MAAKHIITQLDVSLDCFQSDWKKLRPEVQAEARKMLGQMLLCESMPAKLHFHKLKGKDIWTVHVTSDDRYKASFVLKGQTAVMRRIALHDKIDKSGDR